MSSNIEFVNDTLNGGFLSGFVEASVEKPADGRNGACVVHYAGQQHKYKMKVKLVNGMREGIGTILKKGAPFIQVEYHHGLVTGTVCRMDDYGVVEMRGQLSNGMESGLFEEYDDNEKVVWRGYYRNGKRYSEVVKSEQLEGYYDEKSVENGRLLSIAQYDKDLHDKNGRCLEYENGSLRSECEYENGVKKHTSRQFVNERMTVFDSNGKKVYEGKWFGDMKSGFLCHEKMEGMSGYFKEADSSGQLISVSEYDELNVFKNGKCFEMENGKVKRVCVYEKGEMKRVMQEFDGSIMVEYDDNGKRVYEGGWKGDMKSGFVRDGKGIEYEKDGETALYSGQWKSGKRDGKGTEYRDGHALYTGEWKNGMRNGKGKEMDESGRVVFVGEWKDGKGKGKEMDADGNGMYEGEWWNGKRNGVGEVLKGTRWVGYWKDGKMNGMEYEKDENGAMKRGCLFENGVMKRVVQEFDGGKMVEYDENGRKVYEGEYKGNVEKGFVREGFGKEFRMVEEKITSRAKPTIEIEKKRFCCWMREIEHEVAGVELVTKKYREEVVEGYWKDGKKNGMIYELDENGKAKRGCLYENDTMKRVVIEFMGSEMVEYDRNGKKVYEGKWFGDMRSGFSCHEPMEGMSGYFKEVGSSGQLISVSEYDELNVFKNGKCFEIENGKVKRVCVYEKGEMKRVMQEFNGSIMVEYDDNGKRVYEGGWKGDMKSGFVRDGKGYELDENGRVVRSGCWVDGKYKNTVMTPSSLTSNPQGIEELRIGDNGYNDGSVTELKLTGLARLKRIVIGNECFGKVRVFELNGLGELESVVIGQESFRIDTKERSDGSCRIVNCPKLKSIQIGGYSFSDYRSFELSNLPSLQSIDIGENCFYWAPSFSLTGLIDGLV